MDSRTTRRHFFRQAASATGTASLTSLLLGAVEQAASIEAEPGSTFLDAEHVVILMQENRSFDHLFGTLRGVRGFDDPRAVTLPNQNPVWLQTNATGQTFAPFALDLRNTNATWLGSLPHSWRDQIDARNEGNHDGWLEAKRSGRPECAGMPFTLGYYTRTDLPFYYALADAFTVCDQNFCSSLTGTTPNRLFLWSGTIREPGQAGAPAQVRNSDVTYGANARWTTFPERLEEAGITWKIYQNELSLPTGLDDEEEAWLANFTDNPLEWFDQYQVEFSETFRTHAAAELARLPQRMADLDAQLAAATAGTPAMAQLRRRRRSAEMQQAWFTKALAETTPEREARRTERQRRLHERAFCTNAGDPAYRKLEEIRYRDGGTERSLRAPAGDLLYQFRSDVATGQLPAVSWLVPPERCSDHPGSPWYGAWMLSEALRILTERPEVWKKTIFILTYDENDGYFDHVPPFTAPDPGRPESGKVSAGIDAAVEFWPLARDREKRPAAEARGGPVGLGYRVPMVIASPWSRGGNVCSEVFDHTSVLQLLERWLTAKTGRPVRETNISAWRRTVCGDLTSAFQPAGRVEAAKLPHPGRETVLREIHQARFRGLPGGYRALTPAEVAAGWRGPRQERGTRPSMGLPYELYAEGELTADRKAFALTLRAGRTFFGDRASGSPFHVYTPGRFRGELAGRTRAYAVAAGAEVQDAWLLEGFAGGAYALRCHGPNGFYREWTGDAGDPALELGLEYGRDTAGRPGEEVVLVVKNRDRAREYRLAVADLSYGAAGRELVVAAGGEARLRTPLAASFGWYDLGVTVAGRPGYGRRWAGRVETGRMGRSDPAMGRG
jgi:phospholipase C